MNKKAFTLLELLVVVLIIGILAAIALPQYKLVVAKSKYATLKNITKSLKESVDRYYLATGVLATEYKNLDIDFAIKSTFAGSSGSFYIELSTGELCEVYYSPVNYNIMCQKTISKKLMKYVSQAFPWQGRMCSTRSVDVSDISNRVCQSETGKTAAQASCDTSTCAYQY